ncbi:mpv17-like protein 2 [Pectinophora gossypiella]|uniref:mpv17-like protein 2 n=1 Tax=Pectinophora gossypiella TaxID=13191 RepID=UPI00214E5744|nr:mpv17-like protein 2 [Pectinophora gossypiella]
MFSLHCRNARKTSYMFFQRMKSMSLYRRSINYFFKENLLLTNSLSSGGFMALGDMIQQEYEYRQNQIPKRYDWARMKRMFIVGSLLGWGHHHYYLHLDVLLPKTNMKTVFLKVAADQFFCAPITIVCFFYGMGYLENKSVTQCTDELTKKFKYVYLGDWIFWPPVQCINFYFLPSKYRVFYINIATMIFDVYLSLMKHYDQND